jgi:hypothetical protein
MSIYCAYIGSASTNRPSVAQFALQFPLPQSLNSATTSTTAAELNPDDMRQSMNSKSCCITNLREIRRLKSVIRKVQRNIFIIYIT